MSGAASVRPRGEGATPEAIGTVFSPHVLVFQLKARQGPFRHLDLLATLTLTNRWREAILSHTNDLPEPVRRMLSGHGADGGPAEEPHLAFLPLAFVGNEQADGHLLGMGLALPVHLSRDERCEALRAIAAVRDLKMGPLGVWQVDPVTAEQLPQALRPETWTIHPKGATHWCTVTPIALDRHPKASDKARYQTDIAASITDACSRVGLRRPQEVIVTPFSAHLGVPPSFAFPRLQRKDGSERRHTHAILVFDEPACGPMLIGAGRFRGYGVCRPVRGEMELDPLFRSLGSTETTAPTEKTR